MITDHTLSTPIFGRLELRGVPPLPRLSGVLFIFCERTDISRSGVVVTVASGSTLAADFFEKRAGFGRLWFGCDRVGLRQTGINRNRPGVTGQPAWHER